MADVPDNLLVQQSLAGDKDAYCCLVRRYQGCAYAAAIAVLSDMDLAGDVVQEALLRAWLDLPKLREPDRFGPWLRGIVRHMALRALREIGRVQLLAEQLKATSASVVTPAPPDDAAQRSEQRQILQHALNRLGEANREAVWLHYVEDLSYAQIASLLGISQTAVQGRLQRGREELREELAIMENTRNQGHPPDDLSARVHELLKTLGKPGIRKRQVVENLAELGTSAVEPLTQALDHARVPMRVAAARALTRIGDVRALRPILRLLYVPDSYQFSRVFGENDILGIPGVREGLLEALQAGGWRDRGMAIDALSHAKNDPEVYQAILRVFRDAEVDVSVVRDAMDALCRMKPDAAQDILTEALHGRSPRLRGWAARSAFDRRVLPPVEACGRALSGGVDMYDRYIAGKLVLRHGPAGEQALRNLFQTGTAAQSDSAALALARIKDPDALALLRQQVQEGRLHRKWAKFISWVLREIEHGQ